MDSELFKLLKQYDLALPRYTSYPTVPHWNNKTFDIDTWTESIINVFEKENNEVCLYIHLPFCEELCTYCACNKRITKNHSVEEPYINALISEWNKYLQLFPGKPVIREIHLGGGTPTFFSPQLLDRLISSILSKASRAPQHEFSVEVHPNHTTIKHLEVLSKLGFNRISIGVQDFDPKVQYIINRIQTFEQTQLITEAAREAGFKSVNIDLVYGLPLQTTQSVTYTIEQIKKLKPDRIAFYSYAHVPWKSKGQRRYTDEDVPKAHEKLMMYETGSKRLRESGYESIGMDHFALPTDALIQAFKNKKLHRNFMGYTTSNHKLLIGLGASSISDTWTAFAQNEKEIEAYQNKIFSADWAITSGHILSEEDKLIRQYILDLMCKGHCMLKHEHIGQLEWQHIMKSWRNMEYDGLLKITDNKVEVLENGRLFIRNIVSVLDRYLQTHSSDHPQFSKAI